MYTVAVQQHRRRAFFKSGTLLDYPHTSKNFLGESFTVRNIGESAMTNPNGIIFALTEIHSYNFSLSQKTVPTSFDKLRYHSGDENIK